MDTPFSLQMYWQYLRAMILRTQQMNSGMLKPAYPCDVWHQEKRVCLLSGNIGNTVTFVLAAPPPQTAGRIRIEWFQGFSYSDASAWEKNKTYQINPSKRVIIYQQVPHLELIQKGPR
ncbi:hypothetical protein AVEN_82015-1 [Araneus ventricosus]|uniref:Uncharacterized protein n=1 Tax=Araneus ventricosus TaxID=182803 RepID=A0A4Y2UKQ3_ARAVE|nr:hypothetical protein AVEN_82015-1 [Araneus ventricosus]